MTQLKYSSIINIGSGPSGYTSIIYLSKFNLNPILITGNNLGGQLINTNEVDNWPSFVSITGFELMEKFFLHVKNLNIEISFNEINFLNLLFRPSVFFFKMIFYFSEIQIISMGSFPRYLSIFNEKKYLGKNISTCTICDGNFYKNKKIVIIGGGDVAIESLLYLKDISKEIVLIHRNKKLNISINLIKKILINNINNIFFKLNTILIEIIGDLNLLKYIKIINILNKVINVLYIEGLFISIGYKPNVNLFLGQLDIENDFFKLNKFYNFFYKNSFGVFFSGDVKDNFYRQAITSAGSGASAAIESYLFFNKLI